MVISKKDDPNKKVKKGPTLVFLHTKSNAKNQTEEFQSCFNMAEKKCYTEITWQMQEFNCWSTPRGWIFMISPYFKCCLFNFFNKKIIQLPSINYKGSLGDDHCECVVTKRKENYVVMFINYERKCIYFYDDNVRREKWIRHEYEDEGRENDIHAVGSCDGQFFGASCTNFVMIDYTPKPKFTTLEPLNFNRQLGFHCMIIHMLEARGDLYMVCRYLVSASSLETGALVVWKRETSSGLWKKVEDIGDQVFFLGLRSSAAAWSSRDIGSKGNLIYYLKPRDNRLYCYDIEEASVRFDVPLLDVKSQFCSPTWIFPVI